MGTCEIKSPIYKKFIEKLYKCMHTHGRLEYGHKFILRYLFTAIDVTLQIKNINHEINRASKHIQPTLI